MKKNVFGLPALIVALFMGVFVCTIKEGDLGNPVTPGTNTNTNPTGPTVPVDENIPVVLVATHDPYVLVDDTLDIIVTVVKDSVYRAGKSQPYAGARIYVGTSGGWISKDTLVADINGRAVLRYTSSIERENVQVQLACGDQTRTIRFDVTDTPDQIQRLIDAQPQKPSIKADGVDKTTIRVTVIDSNHNPVSNEAVQFISTAGVIRGTNPPSEDHPGRSLTDQNGLATAELTSSNINDTAFITVYLVNNVTLSDEAQVAFHGVSLALDVQEANLAQGETSTLTATLKNASGIPISRAPIFFTVSKGTSSSIRLSSQDDDSLVRVDTITGFDGTARIQLQAVKNGTDSIEVVAAGARSHVVINVTSLKLNAEVESRVLQADPDLNTALRVSFSNASDQPLANKTIQVVRYFQTSSGVETSDTLTGKTNSSGLAAFKIYALPHPTSVRIVVTGFSGDDRATAETTMECIATRSIQMLALPTVILADGTSKSQITVQIKSKETNNPIVGDQVNFSCHPAGMITASATTDANGKATVALTSDRRNTTTKVVAVLASDPTLTDSVEVEFAGVMLRASISPPSIRGDGQDTSKITVSLADANQNPIAGEMVSFAKQQNLTKFGGGDTLTSEPMIEIRTDNRGEARCLVAGTGSGRDTIIVTSAGANDTVFVNYSDNSITIDTVPPGSLTNTYVANGADTTYLTVRYKDGSNQAIANARLEVSATLGMFGDAGTSFFADTVTTGSNGSALVRMINPNFANYATVEVRAVDETMTAARLTLYLKADLIESIELVGTPEVIGTNGDRAKITAIAYDSRRNRVKDAVIAFNLLDGPGGGEILDPPTAITDADGTASTYLISGPLPSNYKEVWVAAGDFSKIKSDTIKFTIAGPPRYITIRREISKITKNADGTYSTNLSALVTDINGNPVADGTEVTFSAKVTGYRIYRKHAWSIRRPWSTYGNYYHIDWEDSLSARDYWFEDLNDNYVLDDGEDRNRDGILNRGEDRNGDGKFNPGPGFEDINWNGVRDTLPEPWEWEYRIVDYDTLNSPVIEPVLTFFDFNGNNQFDLIEPLLGNITEEEYRDTSKGYIPGPGGSLGQYPDIDWNENGAPDPATAVIIQRTVLTQNGRAPNMVTFGQSDALKIWIRVSAEAQGLVCKTPEEFLLPIALDDYPYWSPK